MHSEFVFFFSKRFFKNFFSFHIFVHKLMAGLFKLSINQRVFRWYIWSPNIKEESHIQSSTRIFWNFPGENYHLIPLNFIPPSSPLNLFHFGISNFRKSQKNGTKFQPKREEIKRTS